MLTFIIAYITIINISYSIIIKMTKLPTTENQGNQVEIILSLLYRYSTTFYVGHPLQKINIALLEINQNYSLMILGQQTESLENTCDLNKFSDLDNISYVRDINSPIFEYDIINTSIILGTKDNFEKMFINNTIFYILQYNPEYKFPNAGFINLDAINSKNVLFQYINDEKYFIYLNYSPQNYDLGYKEEYLKRIATLYNLEINGKSTDNINYWGLNIYGFITLSNSHIYNYYYDIFYGCSSELINDFRYYFCDLKKDLSKLKIETNKFILDEKDLVFQTNEYKIPLIRFGNLDDHIIFFGIFLLKNSIFIDNKEIYQYNRLENVNIRINRIESFPFHKAFNFKEKSLDGDDIFPLRFIHKIEIDKIEDLNINIKFENAKSEFKVEVIFIIEDFIELFKKGILLENVYEQKLIYDTLHFSINKHKILSLIIDNEKDFYMYFVVKKNEITIKYNSINCELSIDSQNDNKIEIGKNIIGQIGKQEEIQLYFSNKRNLLLNTNEENLMPDELLIVQISLENNLDFSIINTTILEERKDKNYFYKNSTLFRLVEEYPDRIIIYIDLNNNNVSELMINIFHKNSEGKFENSGYKIKYYIANMFDIPIYKIDSNEKINYEKYIKNDKLSLKIKIPNIKKIVECIVQGYANSTFLVKIYELEKNYNINIAKPIIYTDSYKNIFSIEFNSTGEDIINKEISDININENKKYIVTTYGNISDFDDIILYDSYIFEIEDKNNSSVILAIIIPILIIIIIAAIVGVFYRQKKFCFKNKELIVNEINEISIQLVKQ